MGLTVIHPNNEATAVAKLCIQMVKTAHAEGLAFPHNVPATSERLRAFHAGKMAQMPVATLSLGAFVR